MITETRDRPAATGDRSWVTWNTLGLGAIWLGVLLVSLFSPDLVSGSEQEALPLAAVFAWLWGLLGTGGFVWGMGRLRGSADRKPLWMGFTGAVVVFWATASALGVWLPVFETGSDPTQIPAAAIFAPLGAGVLSALAAVVVVQYADTPR